MALKGLAAFKAEKARQEAAAAERNKPRANYFNWKNNKNKEDRNTVYIRFLQEFDEGIEGFVPERGLPLMAVEHQAPGKEGFKRRASCTYETEGQCYACERHREDRAEMKRTGRTQPVGWGQKKNFYTWVLVDYKDGEGEQPVVLSRNFNSSFVEDLLLEVEEDDHNQITNKMWKVTKSGEGTKTTWKLRKASGIDLYDDADVELIDLEEAVLRKVAYDDQAAYYGAVYKDGDPVDGDDSEETPKASASPREETGELTW